MRAMVLRKAAPIEAGPLEWTNWPDPVPGLREILIQVSVCGVCHTELDEIEGRIQPRLPIIPGHEVVGKVVQSGSEVTQHKRAARTSKRRETDHRGDPKERPNPASRLCSTSLG
jgi:alcohol dehydrogenase, propanol-preferring